MRQRVPGKRRTGRVPAIGRVGLCLFGVGLLVAAPVVAHQLDHRIVHGEAVVVTLAYGNGRPLAGAEYRIYAPEPGQPFARGRTDANGTLAFRPDRAGEWRILVSEAGGHGASLTVEIDKTLGVIDMTGDGESRIAMLVAGVGYIAGLAALLAFWLGRR